SLFAPWLLFPFGSPSIHKKSVFSPRSPVVSGPPVAGGCHQEFFELGGAPIGGVRMQDHSAGRGRYALASALRQWQRGDNLVGAVRHRNLAACRKKSIETRPIVRNDRGSACCCLKQTNAG